MILLFYVASVHFTRDIDGMYQFQFLYPAVGWLVTILLKYYNFIIPCAASWEQEPSIEISRAGAGVVLLPGPISVIPDSYEINYFTTNSGGPGISCVYFALYRK